MASVTDPVIGERAVLSRLVRPTRICRAGARAGRLLSQGWVRIEGKRPTSRTERDEVEAEHVMAKTPQTVSAGRPARSRRYVDCCKHLKVADLNVVRHRSTVAMSDGVQGFASATDRLTGARLGGNVPLGLVSLTGRMIATWRVAW